MEIALNKGRRWYGRLWMMIVPNCCRRNWDRKDDNYTKIQRTNLILTNSEPWERRIVDFWTLWTLERMIFNLASSRSQWLNFLLTTAFYFTKVAYRHSYLHFLWSLLPIPAILSFLLIGYTCCRSIPAFHTIQHANIPTILSSHSFQSWYIRMSERTSKRKKKKEKSSIAKHKSHVGTLTLANMSRVSLGWR